MSFVEYGGGSDRRRRRRAQSPLLRPTSHRDSSECYGRALQIAYTLALPVATDKPNLQSTLSLDLLPKMLPERLGSLPPHKKCTALWRRARPSMD